MGIFHEIHQEMTDKETAALLENMDHSLTPNEIKKLVDFVVDEQRNGNKEDVGELVGQALENMAGMEGIDETDMDKVVSQVARAVKLKNEFTKRQSSKK